MANPFIFVRDVVVGENDPFAEFILSLSSPSTEVVSVNYATFDQTANVGYDYVQKSGVINFAPGQTSQSLKISITNDTTVENQETFGVNFKNPVKGTLITTEAIATIIDNDSAAGVPNITVLGQTVNESDGVVQFNVILDKPSSNVIKIDYKTVNNNAISGADYINTTGTLTFVPGDVAKTVAVPIVNDTIKETSETFNLTLSNLKGQATITTSIATATITDDDPVTIPVASNDLVNNIYRFYNSNSKGHFFSGNTSEIDAVMAHPEWGYTFEGVGFEASL